MAMDLIDINENPLTRRGASVPGGSGAQMPRIAGPGATPNPPAQQVPFYDPQSVPRIAGPQTISEVAADSSRALPAQAPGPLSRAASMAPDAAPAAGAIGLLAGGAAATGLAGGTVAANPDYFRSSIGDDGLAANIMSAAQPPTIADVARQAPETARTQNGPTNVPVIAQNAAGNSMAGGGRGFINPPNVTPAAPGYDLSGRDAEMSRITNQAYREQGDPIGDIIGQKLGAPGGDQPPADGGGSFLNVGAQSGGQPPQAPISFATYGGGTESTKAYRTDGSTTDLRPGMMSGQGLPADVQAFNQQSAQAGMDSQQPVSVIRGLNTSVAIPNPTAAQAAGYMQEVPTAVADGGADAINKYQSAQTQSAVNAADPLAAKTAAELAKVKEENKGKLDVANANAIHAKVPPGYRPTATGNLEAVPGGPADLKLQGAFNADTAQLTSSNASMDRLAIAANEVMKHPGLDGIAGWRGALPNFPGSDAANANALLNTLKSQVGFGVLQDMRNNSKTGGALGSVSDAEGKRLEANLAALEKAQSPQQLRESLQKIIDYSSAAKERMLESYNLRHGNAGDAVQRSTVAPAAIAGKPPAAGAGPASAPAAGSGTAAAPGSLNRDATRMVPFNGANAEARLAPDGHYYVMQSNGKYARVND